MPQVRIADEQALAGLGFFSSASCLRVLLAMIVLALAPASLRAERPNVLWICADDHAAYVCGAYGNPQVRTPNIDRLAAAGIRFDRAYCNSPVCTASRQSFLTGRYPRTIGVTALQTALPDGEVTLAEMLKEAGYETAAFGKMHFNSNRMHGFDRRLDRPDYVKWLAQKKPAAIDPQVKVLPPWRPFKDPARIWLNGSSLPYAAREADMMSTYLAREASRFLFEKRDRPFFLMVSFTEPHSPFHFPIEYAGRHHPGQFTAPRVGPEDDWQIPAIFRELTNEEKQGIIASYYTSAEFLDANVGRVLAALDESGKGKNTLVIYTGDHGYMLGHHGRFEKHCSYEQAVRAPLVLRQPGLIPAGTATGALVEFIDIVPTVLEACGLAVPAAVQGKSLLSLAAGRTNEHRQQVVIEYAENEEAAIRTERWKLVYITGRRARQDGYETGRPLPGRTVLLFDEHNDPGEFTNLASRTEHAGLVADLTRRLADHMQHTAREPELLPRSADVHALLEFCLQPRDVK